MLKIIFTLICGFFIGALVIENKTYFSNVVAIPLAVLPDGGQYDGELLKGTPHDRGRIVWPNGDYYDGEFRDGLFHGLGRYKTELFTYEGEFVDGVATGTSLIDYVDESVYEGDVVDFKPHGSGVMTLVDGSEYTGEFKDGLFSGEGVLVAANGDRYEGEFAEGVYDGQGVFTSAAGIIFQGQFVDGALTGKGEYRDEAVSYSGEFSDWLFAGEGEYVREEYTYKGSFLANQFHGVGELINESGSHYRGDFQAGLFHGEGILDNNEGRYEGGFEFGRKHGKGILTYPEPVDGMTQITGEWRYGQLQQSNNPLAEYDSAVIAEYALFNQQQMLASQLSAVVENDPDRIDLYFIGIGGDGEEGVFRREVNFIRQQFDQHYGTEGKSAILLNSRVTWKETPLATVESIERLLKGIDAKMDPEQDILFLYLTSHGSSDFNFQLQQPGIALNSLSADALGELLQALDVKHKVVVISACYSGGFVIPVKSATTMIMTAAAEDKTSFGCSDTSEMTYFGEAFFKDALPQSNSFAEAFEKAREIVRGREAKEGFEYSNPLMFNPEAMKEHLAKWRIDLKALKREQQMQIPSTE